MLPDSAKKISFYIVITVPTLKTYQTEISWS